MRCWACWHFLLFDYNKPFLWSVVSAHENVTSRCWIEMIVIVRECKTKYWVCCDSAGEASLDWQRDRRREGGKRGRASLHGPLYLLWPRFERDLEAGQLFEFRGMPGSSEAWQRLRWKRDRPAVQTPKCHSTWQTASFFFFFFFAFFLERLPSFLPLSSDPPEIQALYSFFLLKHFFLLKSLTWLQPGGFFSWIWDNMRV